MSNFKVGFAKRDITPETERQTIYHRSGSLDDTKTPIRDRLFARATAFRSGNQISVWVTTDLLCVGSKLREAVTARLNRRGVQSDKIALCATHTHTSPTVVKFHGVDPTPESYLRYAESQIADAVFEALASVRPARISFGKANVDLSVNRRQIGRMSEINDINSPTGLVDNEVIVAVVELEGEQKSGVLFNYAAHSLAMSRNRSQISADYPGRAVRYLEGEGGFGFAQFLQGCAGNLNIKFHGDEEEADMAGKWLGQAVLGAAASAEPSASSEVCMVTETVRLPWGEIASKEEAMQAMSAKPDDRRTVEWARGVIQAHDENSISPHAEVIVQAAKIGDAVFVALPGEVFVEIGLAIKRAADVEDCFVVAYSNNCEVGYIPTAAAFSEGGYEVDSAPHYYGLFRLSPECERIMVDAGLGAVRSVLEGEAT